MEKVKDNVNSNKLKREDGKKESNHGVSKRNNKINSNRNKEDINKDNNKINKEDGKDIHKRLTTDKEKDGKDGKENKKNKIREEVRANGEEDKSTDTQTAMNFDL